jgi:isopenicillin N synthase-like dioxygenase
MSFTSIPILDLALAQDPATKPEFLSELRHALMEVGFLYLKNVGISDEFFQEVIEEGRAFFDIPTEEKYGQHTQAHSLSYLWRLRISPGSKLR